MGEGLSRAENGILLPLQRSGAQEALTGVRNARATLLAGFTTVRDVGTYIAWTDRALDRFPRSTSPSRWGRADAPPRSVVTATRLGNLTTL